VRRSPVTPAGSDIGCDIPHTCSQQGVWGVWGVTPAHTYCQRQPAAERVPGGWYQAKSGVAAWAGARLATAKQLQLRQSKLQHKGQNLAGWWIDTPSDPVWNQQGTAMCWFLHCTLDRSLSVDLCCQTSDR
jgi:hypothetical protein